MTREELLTYVREQYNTIADNPWNDDNAVLRHQINNKWYGLVMRIPKSKLGLPSDSIIDVLNVKCDPVMSGFLRNQIGIYPAYHMNKTQWISIDIGTVANEEICNLLNQSYELTAPKKKS